MEKAPPKCRVCNEVFPSMAEHHDHIHSYLHHKMMSRICRDVTQHNCFVCSRMFNSLQDFSAHTETSAHQTKLKEKLEFLRRRGPVILDRASNNLSARDSSSQPRTAGNLMAPSQPAVANETNHTDFRTPPRLKARYNDQTEHHGDESLPRNAPTSTSVPTPNRLKSDGRGDNKCNDTQREPDSTTDKPVEKPSIIGSPLHSRKISQILKKFSPTSKGDIKPNIASARPSIGSQAPIHHLPKVVESLSGLPHAADLSATSSITVKPLVTVPSDHSQKIGTEPFRDVTIIAERLKCDKFGATMDHTRETIHENDYAPFVIKSRPASVRFASDERPSEPSPVVAAASIHATTSSSVDMYSQREVKRVKRLTRRFKKQSALEQITAGLSKDKPVKKGSQDKKLKSKNKGQAKQARDRQGQGKKPRQKSKNTTYTSPKKNKKSETKKKKCQPQSHSATPVLISMRAISSNSSYNAPLDYPPSLSSHTHSQPQTGAHPFTSQSPHTRPSVQPGTAYFKPANDFFTKNVDGFMRSKASISDHVVKAQISRCSNPINPRANPPLSGKTREVCSTKLESCDVVDFSELETSKPRKAADMLMGSYEAVRSAVEVVEEVDVLPENLNKSTGSAVVRLDQTSGSTTETVDTVQPEDAAPISALCAAESPATATSLEQGHRAKDMNMAVGPRTETNGKTGKYSWTPPSTGECLPSKPKDKNKPKSKSAEHKKVLKNSSKVSLQSLVSGQALTHVKLRLDQAIKQQRQIDGSSRRFHKDSTSARDPQTDGAAGISGELEGNPTSLQSISQEELHLVIEHIQPEDKPIAVSEFEIIERVEADSQQTSHGEVQLIDADLESSIPGRGTKRTGSPVDPELEPELVTKIMKKITDSVHKPSQRGKRSLAGSRSQRCSIGRGGAKSAVCFAELSRKIKTETVKSPSTQCLETVRSTRRPDGAPTTHRPDEDQTTQRLETVRSTRRPDGDQTTQRLETVRSTRRPDGAQTTHRPDEDQTTQRPDGARTTQHPDEAQTTRHPDGAQTTRFLFDAQSTPLTVDRPISEPPSLPNWSPVENRAHRLPVPPSSPLNLEVDILESNGQQGSTFSVGNITQNRPQPASKPNGVMSPNPPVPSLAGTPSIKMATKPSFLTPENRMKKLLEISEKEESVRSKLTEKQGEVNSLLDQYRDIQAKLHNLNSQVAQLQVEETDMRQQRLTLLRSMTSAPPSDPPSDQPSDPLSTSGTPAPMSSGKLSTAAISKTSYNATSIVWLERPESCAVPPMKREGESIRAKPADRPAAANSRLPADSTVPNFPGPRMSENTCHVNTSRNDKKYVTPDIKPDISKLSVEPLHEPSNHIPASSKPSYHPVVKQHVDISSICNTSQFCGHTDFITRIRIDGDELYTSSADKTLLQWSLKTGLNTRVYREHSFTIKDFVLHHSKAGPLSRTSLCSIDQAGACCVWDTQSTVVQMTRDLTDKVKCVATALDNSKFYVALQCGDVLCLSLPNLVIASRWEHTSPIISLCALSEGARDVLAIASLDGTVNIHTANNGLFLRTAYVTRDNCLPRLVKVDPDSWLLYIIRHNSLLIVSPQEESAWYKEMKLLTDDKITDISMTSSNSLIIVTDLGFVYHYDKHKVILKTCLKQADCSLVACIAQGGLVFTGDRFGLVQSVKINQEMIKCGVVGCGIPFGSVDSLLDHAFFHHQSQLSGSKPLCPWNGCVEHISKQELREHIRDHAASGH